jgi:hypothetical protein
MMKVPDTLTACVPRRKLETHTHRSRRRRLWRLGQCRTHLDYDHNNNHDCDDLERST